MPPSAMRTSAVASAIRRRLRTGAGGRSFSPGGAEAVAGDAEHERVAPERVLGQHVEREPGAEAGEAARLGPARERDAADDDEDEVGRAGDEREVGGDGELEQHGERQRDRDHGGVAGDAARAHGDAVPREVRTSTCENASRSTSGVTWMTFTSASPGSLTCVTTPIGMPWGSRDLNALWSPASRSSRRRR